MSGHSRWSNIKRTKGKSDAVKARVFTKIGRELAVAIKAGGADPSSNSRLRDVIAKAKAANMPSDNINRSIKKASGELNSVNYENIVYEGYGAGGAAVIVETLTDNKNRTAGEVRHKFDKYGGSMGTTGCVSYMFDTKGVVVIAPDSSLSEDDVMMLALQVGADDCEADDDGGYILYTSPADFSRVREALEAEGVNIVSSEVDRIPVNTVSLSQEDLARFEMLIERLEDDDDVQNIYHNVDLPETGEEE